MYCLKIFALTALLIQLVCIAHADEEIDGLIKAFAANAESIVRFDAQLSDEADIGPTKGYEEKLAPTENRRKHRIVVDYEKKRMVYAGKIQTPQFRPKGASSDSSMQFGGLIIAEYKNGEAIIQLFPNGLQVKKVSLEDFSLQLEIPYVPLVGMLGPISTRGRTVNEHLDIFGNSYSYLKKVDVTGDVVKFAGVPTPNPEQHITLQFDKKRFLPVHQVVLVEGQEKPLSSTRAEFKVEKGINLPVLLTSDSTWGIQLDNNDIVQAQTVGVIQVHWNSVNDDNMEFPDTTKLFDDAEAVLKFINSKPAVER